MPNPNNPDEAECQSCYDSGFAPGSYTPCRFCRPEEYEKFWADQSEHSARPTTPPIFEEASDGS